MMRRSRSIRGACASRPAATAYSTGTLWLRIMTCSALVRSRASSRRRLICRSEFLKPSWPRKVISIIGASFALDHLHHARVHGFGVFCARNVERETLKGTLDVIVDVRGRDIVLVINDD